MNFYSVLDDSDDEDTPKTPKPVVNKKVEEKKPQAAPKATSKPKAAPAPEAPAPQKTAPAGSKAANKEKKENAPRNNAANAAPVAPVSAAAEEATSSKANERGGSRDNRKRDGRGGRGGRGEKANNGDRRKSSGRGRGVDRGGRGPYNWGNPAEDSRLAEKNPDLANPDAEVVDENDAKPVEVEEVEPQAPQLSYEDYLAQRNQARANQEIFGAVKERSVEKDLAGIQIKDADDLNDFMVLGDGKSNRSKSSKEQRSAALAKQMLLDVGFKNAALESNRDRDDDRGTRNGGKDKRSGGGRSKGSPTSRSSSGAKIDISDTSAFPSL